MDLEFLRKKISSYKTTTGKLTKVPDELALEILLAWEQWKGPAKGFYVEIDAKQRKMAGVLGRAKRLRRDGSFAESDFKEIKIDMNSGKLMELSPCQGVELVWDNGKLLRFSQVDLLLEFLKKAA